MKKYTAIADLSVLNNDDSKLVYLYIELLKQPKFNIILDADQIIENLGMDYERFNKAISELVLNDMAVYDAKRCKYDTVSPPVTSDCLGVMQ